MDKLTRLQKRLDEHISSGNTDDALLRYHQRELAKASNKATQLSVRAQVSGVMREASRMYK